MALQLAPLFVALCIADQSWIAEMRASREAFTPPSMHVSFCRSQVALNKYGVDIPDGKVTCVDVVEPKNAGRSNSQKLAHAAAVNACIVNHCTELKSNTEKFSEEELKDIQAILHNSGQTEDEIEASFKLLKEKVAPKRHDCLENSKDGYLASALAWDFCVNRPYSCGEEK